MPLQLEFVTSAKRHVDLPDSPAEVAFVGRSNVGKSSLINALANRRQLAKVSNTPGRTQLINLFRLPNGAALVDLPGYGYAAVPAREQRTWQAMIEGYLLEREALQLVFVLVDGEIGPTKLDQQMLDWLRANGVPHQVVATKSDKLSNNQRGASTRIISNSLGGQSVVMSSAQTGAGCKEIWKRVLEATAIIESARK